MLATTVPVRSETGPAHVSLGGDQRGEPTGQAVPSRLPAQFSYTATARVATSREVMDQCRPKLLRHLPHADFAGRGANMSRIARPCRRRAHQALPPIRRHALDVLLAVGGRDSFRAAHAAPRWVPASSGTATAGGGLTSPPQAFSLSARPAARMFRAAFTSRSCTAPHAAHDQTRTPSGLGPSFAPQPEQVWDVGTNRPTGHRFHRSR